MTIGKTQRKKYPANFVGPQIRRLRAAHGWSQSKLAERLQLNGLDVGREVVAQIEGQTHCVRDDDLLYFAHVLKVGVADLFFADQNGCRAIATAIATLQAVYQPKFPRESCNEIITTW
ncbi:MAG TPA: helix-turn-helix transcriptional regulator [Candidatus Saccharimonadales bacterium]|nr:helix-turn-helix transcriptional regulator [Candidatus Saccharimonadales bacterium]